MIELTAPAAGETVVTVRSARVATRNSSPVGSARRERSSASTRPGRRGALRPTGRPARLPDPLHRHELRGRARAAPRRRRLRRCRLHGSRGVLAQITWERGFSYATTPARHADGHYPGARRARGRQRWEERRLAQVFRTYGEERYNARSRGPHCARARASADRDDERAGRDHQGGDPDAIAIRGGDPPGASFSRCGSRSTTSWARSSAPARAWSLLASDGRLAAISFHSLEDRRVKQFIADRARGCICPPDLPICVVAKSLRPS